MWSFSPITYKYVAQVKYANGGIYSESENEITSNNTLSQYDANLIISKLNQLKEIMNISDNVLQEITTIVNNYVGVLYVVQVDYPFSGTYVGSYYKYVSSGMLTPFNAPYGSPSKNKWNEYGTTYTLNNYGSVGNSIDTHANETLMSLFNIISYQIENNLISPSDDLINIVESQFDPVKSDTSFI